MLSPFQLKKGFVGSLCFRKLVCLLVCNLNKLNKILVLKEFVLIYILTGRIVQSIKEISKIYIYKDPDLRFFKIVVLVCS